MCTIIVLNQVQEEFPMIIAANREELTSRGATGPKILETAPRIVGGQDLAAGGTWMGATASGFFAGLTNQYGSLTMDTSDTSMLSRGALVMDVLRADGVADARRVLERLDARRYRAFNLLFGDGHEMWIAYGRSEREAVAMEPLPQGIHVLPNDRINAPDNRKVGRASSLAAAAAAGPWSQCLPGLQAMLADHDKPTDVELDALMVPSMMTREHFQELMALCIHTPGYATRSSTIIALSPDAVGHYLFAHGAPCQHAFEDATHLLD